MPHPIPAQKSPQWLGHLASDVDPLCRDWLLDQGSLTRRLSLLAAGRFSVTPLCEAWQVMRDEECEALDVPLGSIGWVREVYLSGNGQPWVFARSVAARSTLEQGGLPLDTLGNRSLGEWLFCDQAFVRRPIEVGHYPADWLPVEQVADGLWGRRSRFDRDRLSLLVAEVFLPTLWLAARAQQENDPCT